jgi:hypothetical protein
VESRDCGLVFQDLCGGTEEYHGTLQAVLSVSRLRFESYTSKMQEGLLFEPACSVQFDEIDLIFVNTVMHFHDRRSIG